MRIYADRALANIMFWQHDLRTHVAQCLRTVVFNSHHRAHRLALFQ